MVLTSQRILWLEKGSIQGESYKETLRIHLEDVDDVSLAGGSPSIISLVQGEAADFFHLYSPTANTQQPRADWIDEAKPVFIVGDQFLAFKHFVLKHVNARKQQVESARIKDRVQVVLDFSFLKEYMEKGGLLVQKIACTNCGGRMKLPETGSSTECPYCHTTYHVEDILERVKKLIG